MRLVDDAAFVLRRAWSVRLIVIAAVLSGLEVGLGVLTTYAVQLPIPAGLFAGLSGAVSIAAFGARFVAQKKADAS